MEVCFYPFPTAFVEGRRFISDASQRKDLYDRMQLGKYACTGVCNTSVFHQCMGENLWKLEEVSFTAIIFKEAIKLRFLVPSFQKARDSLSCVPV